MIGIGFAHAFVGIVWTERSTTATVATIGRKNMKVKSLALIACTIRRNYYVNNC